MPSSCKKSSIAWTTELKTHSSIKILTWKNFPNLFSHHVSSERIILKKPLSRLLSIRTRGSWHYLLDLWKVRKEVKRLLMNFSKIQVFGIGILIGFALSVKSRRNTPRWTSATIISRSSRKQSRFLQTCLTQWQVKISKNWLIMSSVLVSGQSWNLQLAYL